MLRILIIIFFFRKIFSYDNITLNFFKSLQVTCNNCLPYRLKFSSDGDITMSIHYLYSSQNSRLSNETYPFVKLNKENKFEPFIPNNNNISSVMGYSIDKDNKYYILDQGKILMNNYSVVKDTAKLIVYDPNNKQSKEYQFKGIDLDNSILTDIVVDHDAKYAYITDSGNLNKTNSNPGIIVLDLKSEDAYKILNNHESFKADKNYNSEKSGINDKIKDFFNNAIGVNNIQISCNDETIYYSSLKSNKIYSVSTKDILDEIGKKSKNLNNIKVNSVDRKFESDNFIISSKENIFMTNSESKSIDVFFYINKDLSSYNSDLNSKIKINDNNIFPYSLEIYDGNLYILSNNFDTNYVNSTIYQVELKNDELNVNIGCTVFIFKAYNELIFLLIWFCIILCVAILLIIVNSGTKLEKSKLMKEIEKEEEINELNRELNG